MVAFFCRLSRPSRHENPVSRARFLPHTKAGTPPDGKTILPPVRSPTTPVTSSEHEMRAAFSYCIVLPIGSISVVGIVPALTDGDGTSAETDGEIDCSTDKIGCSTLVIGGSTGSLELKLDS